MRSTQSSRNENRESRRPNSPRRMRIDGNVRGFPSWTASCTTASNCELQCQRHAAPSRRWQCPESLQEISLEVDTHQAGKVWYSSVDGQSAPKLRRAWKVRGFLRGTTWNIRSDLIMQVKCQCGKLEHQERASPVPSLHCACRTWLISTGCRKAQGLAPKLHPLQKVCTTRASAQVTHAAALQNGMLKGA